MFYNSCYPNCKSFQKNIMGTGRLEAFSDGVLAVIITIMVLEIKVPHGDDLISLRVVLPVFISYILSFINIGIYWNNHHHLMQSVEHVNGKVLWANMNLLFWLSLVPFASGRWGKNKNQHSLLIPLYYLNTLCLLRFNYCKQISSF